jgi:CDP-glycerol glycerophosphotransferase (TagB/SpsB family)
MFLDVLDDFRFFKDKIAVYGNVLQEYLLSTDFIPGDKIIVCGSPKYDSFKPITKKSNEKKIILVTLRPIISHVEGMRIELYKKYETAINSIIESCSDLPNNEIIFKLHPQQNDNNQFLKDVIKEKNAGAKIIQSTSIKKLLVNCDLHINLAPDNFDISSVVLEAMILKRPTLNIQLQSNQFEFGIIKENAIKTIMYDSDIRQEISELIFNKEKINQLLKNSEVYLNKYISNQGNASKILLDKIIKK